jgi:hypothetical protein
LIFDKKKMSAWWQSGFKYAATKNITLNEVKE